jgi:hypothetical protein
MSSLRRKCLLSLGCSLVLASILAGWLAPAPVHAGGNQPLLPGGSSLKPGGETPIQMTAEVVTMDIRPATEADNALVRLPPKTFTLQIISPVWFPAIAEVQADFTMKNPTSGTLSMVAWFPLASALENVDWSFYSRSVVPRIETFQGSVDGQPVDYAVSELPNPQAAGMPSLPWASFPVTFPAGRETVIHVRYLLPLQPSWTGNEMALYYIFSTGAGWAGPVGRTELILNLPYPASSETLAGMPSGSLRLPLENKSMARADLPAGARLEGNQARWIWKDLQAGSHENFTIWLLQPSKWQKLAAARSSVEARPQDGQAWLDLASTYYSLSWAGIRSGVEQPLYIFSSSYLSSGIQAYKQAASLMPENPAPSAGLGLLVLVPHMTAWDASPQELQYVQDKLQIASELAARNPAWTKTAGISAKLLAILKAASDLYAGQAATATALSAATRTAATPGVAETATPTPARLPAHTATLFPSGTPQPAPATPTVTGKTTGSGQSPIILLAAAALGLLIVGYLALKRLPKSAGIK